MNRTAKRLPRGCDQQGRYPEAADVEPDDEPDHNLWTNLAHDVLITVCVLVALYVVLAWGVGVRLP